MCEPATLTAVALGISAAASIGGAAYTYDQSKKQIKANNEMASIEQEELRQQKSVEMEERMREARLAQAQVRAAAADSGVGGASVGAMLQDIQAQTGRNVALTERNRRNSINASQAQNRARNNAAYVNPWAEGLKVAGDVSSTAVNYYGRG